MSPVVREAIDWYIAEGGLFTVDTGRTPNELSRFDYSMVNAPMILTSGSLIVNRLDETPLLDLPFDEEGYRIAREVWEIHPEISSLAVDDYMVTPRVIRGEALTFDEVRAVLSYPWHKVQFYVDHAEDREPLERDLCTRYATDYVFDSAWVRSVEMHYGTKGTGALALKKQLGAKVLCCVGDHTNDLTMIRAADIGCAMGNALAETKAAADITLPSNEEDGIAYMIRHLRIWAEERKLL